MTKILNNFTKAITEVSLEDIAKLTDTKLVLPLAVNGNKVIKNVSSLKMGTKDDVSFFNNMKYVSELADTKVAACFIEETNVKKAPQGLILFISKDPYGDFSKLAGYFYRLPKFTHYVSDKAEIDESAVIGKNVFISPFALIGENAIIGDNTYIGSGVVIGNGVVIGSNCYIHAHVSIKYAKIGNDCIIHEGVRIGQDGFGFAPNPLGHIKIPQIAGVVIGNLVEIGANTCIDRGALSDTEILDGTKIDNMVQIAHGVKIGRHCFLAAQVGIAGSTIIEDYVSIGGNSGIAPHIVIKKGAQIAPMSGVAGDVDEKAVLIGVPAINFTRFWRLQAMFKKLLDNKI